MSQQVTRRCDLKIREGKKYRVCGNEIPSDEPTVFSLADKPYAGDFCDDCKMRLQEALAPFIEACDPALVNIGPAVRSALKALAGRASEADIRAWALENDIEVSSMGRVAKDVQDAYHEAHTGK